MSLFILYTPETNRGFQITSFHLWHQNVIYKTISTYVKRPWILVVNGFSHWYISWQINMFQGYSFLSWKKSYSFLLSLQKILQLKKTTVENLVVFIICVKCGGLYLLWTEVLWMYSRVQFVTTDSCGRWLWKKEGNRFNG